MKTHLTSVFAAAVCIVGGRAAGDGLTNTINDGADDWASTNSYADTSFVPGTNDTVYVPADATVYITNAAQAEFVCRFARIHPLAPTSRIVVDVPDGGDWHITCGISSVKLNAAGNKDFVNGELVKRGTGTLTIGEEGRLPASNSASTVYDAWTGLTVEEGTLCLPQNISRYWNFYCGYVTISNGATFRPAQRATDYTGDGAYTYVRGLFGGGTMALDQVLTFTTMGEANQRVSEFSGKITGCPAMNVYNGGTLNLTGTNSDIDVTAFNVGSGTLGVMFFGSAGDATSSVGGPRIGVNINNQAGPYSRVRYLGTGENTDQEFTISQTAPSKATVGHPAYLDGGEHGGLVLNAASSISVGSSATNSAGVKLGRRFILTGEHTNDCVIAGAVKGNYYSTPRYYDSLYFIKEGTGAWRFKDHHDRTFASGFAVREGTLKFDSLQEKGALCSLGLATNLTDGTGYAYTPQKDYAFSLGPTNGAAAAPAVLEYTGTNGFICTTRPIALAGDGTLRNSTDRRIRFAGVSALAEGAAVKTFTLDGSGTNFNEVADIADGDGRTGVAKTGTGTWVLSGDQTFTGPLEVKEGTLIARPTLPGLFTWFRWTIRDSGNDGTKSINSLGLYATNNTCQTRIMSVNPNVAELERGEVGLQSVYSYVETPQGSASGALTNMFLVLQNYGWQPQFKNIPTADGSGQILPKADSPHTWIPLVFRQPSAAQPIATFDFMNTWNSKSNPGKCITGFSLEGSVDGLHWNMLTNMTDIALPSASFTWIGSGTALAYGERTGNFTHLNGFPIQVATGQTYSMLESVASVSVATGATFRAEGNVTLSSIRLDAAGGGTFDGFTFAENGTLDVTGVSARGPTVTIPVTFAHPKDLAKVSGWTLTVNGGPNRYKRHRVTETGVTLVGNGLTISLH